MGVRANQIPLYSVLFHDLQNRFEHYFGGPYLELGHLLYKSFFGAQLAVEEGRFVVAMTTLEKLSWKRGEHHEAEEFYFTVFSDGRDTISREGE